jgi:thioredoxin 1
MTLNEFTTVVADTDRPTIIDVWAPWCGPCKAMKPVFDTLSREYGDRARVMAINADEDPEIVQHLQVYAIPTVVVFRGGSEIARRKGAQSENDLRGLFDATVEGREVPAMSNRNRVLRIAGAVGASVLAGRLDPSWPMQILAAFLVVSAIHDRCPIIQALKRPFARRSADVVRS